MQPRNHGSMCPTRGVANARYTRGSIEDGPGVIISRTGGLSSPIGLVMALAFRGNPLADKKCKNTRRPRYALALAFEDTSSHREKESVPHRPNWCNGQIGRIAEQPKKACRCTALVSHAGTLTQTSQAAEASIAWPSSSTRMGTLRSSQTMPSHESIFNV